MWCWWNKGWDDGMSDCVDEKKDDVGVKYMLVIFYYFFCLVKWLDGWRFIVNGCVGEREMVGSKGVVGVYGVW